MESHSEPWRHRAMCKSFCSFLLINTHKVHGSRYFVSSEQLGLLFHVSHRPPPHTNPLFSWSHPGEPELLTPRGCLGCGPLNSCRGFTSELAPLPAHRLHTGPTAAATIRQLIFSVRKKVWISTIWFIGTNPLFISAKLRNFSFSSLWCLNLYQVSHTKAGRQQDYHIILWQWVSTNKFRSKF